VCRDICNCSGGNCLRKKNGWASTGELARQAENQGYDRYAPCLRRSGKPCLGAECQTARRMHGAARRTISSWASSTRPSWSWSWPSPSSMSCPRRPLVTCMRRACTATQHARSACRDIGELRTLLAKAGYMGLDDATPDPAIRQRFCGVCEDRSGGRGKRVASRLRARRAP
jgi:hypothetical protein